MNIKELIVLEEVWLAKQHVFGVMLQLVECTRLEVGQRSAQDHWSVEIASCNIPSKYEELKQIAMVLLFNSKRKHAVKATISGTF